MDLHGEIMNITVEKRKQNLAIDEAMKTHKNMKDILVAVYARGHRDARHAAAEKAAQPRLHPTYGTLPAPEVYTTPEDFSAPEVRLIPPISG